MDDEPQVMATAQLLDGADVADALKTDRFRQFLDHIPVAIAVSELLPDERVTYANFEFERLTGQSLQEIEGKTWADVTAIRAFADRLVATDAADDDYIGSTELALAETPPLMVDFWANVIQDDDGAPMFRLVAAAETVSRDQAERAEHARRIQEKDTLMRELQHRVTNNLQMITTLIRIEARKLPPDAPDDPFTRLAGRVGSLAVLYRLLSEDAPKGSVDLGAYLTQIASAVMQAHSTEGVRLDLKVDSWPVSVNVAMPTGLVVNELLTNALKHAFDGRDRGTITLHSLVDARGCEVTIADDGQGLPQGLDWPQKGRLGYLIVQSLRENAKAEVEVSSKPGEGTRVTLRFAKAGAAPVAG